MNTEKELPQRKPLRLQDFDYNASGDYFVTLCTHKRQNTLSCLVGAIHESPEIQLTELGRIVDGLIASIPQRFGVLVDAYVIMPNHIHFVLSVDGERGSGEVFTQGRSMISKVVGYIKMNASKEIRARYGDVTVWQRGFYDHVIRNREDYDKIINYIDENPVRWNLDELYTEE